MKNAKHSPFTEGLIAGVPIGLGYFAVSFSLGIMAKKAALTPLQGFIASFFNLASAGEYALFTSIAQGVSYAEVALITLVINARYLLMSCALSQKFSSHTHFIHRLLVGFAVTDEIFGVTISRAGTISPAFNYAVMTVAVPLWSIGTALGIIAGNMLPAIVVNSLSVALYGMFLAIIIPPAKKNPFIAIAVIVSFALSYVFSVAPLLRGLSGGNRNIILTVSISVILALVHPVKEEEGKN